MRGDRQLCNGPATGVATVSLIEELQGHDQELDVVPDLLWSGVTREVLVMLKMRVEEKKEDARRREDRRCA